MFMVLLFLQGGGREQTFRETRSLRMAWNGRVSGAAVHTKEGCFGGRGGSLGNRWLHLSGGPALCCRAGGGTRGGTPGGTRGCRGAGTRLSMHIARPLLAGQTWASALRQERCRVSADGCLSRLLSPAPLGAAGESGAGVTEGAAPPGRPVPGDWCPPHDWWPRLW